jgi:hypothetical protein
MAEMNFSHSFPFRYFGGHKQCDVPIIDGFENSSPLGVINWKCHLGKYGKKDLACGYQA